MNDCKGNSRMLTREMRLVYIIGTYPRLTTTFIDREMKILRQWGVDLQVVAIRRPSADMPLSEDQRELQQGVVYLLPIDWLQLFLSHLHFALLQPRCYFKTLAYLLTRLHPDIKARFMTLLHFAEGVYAAHLLRGNRYDQIHAHFLDRAATVALVASRLIAVPYSLTAHANDIYVRPVLLSEKMSEAAFVTTCTAYNKAHLAQISEGTMNSSQLHLVYHGLDTSAYRLPPHPDGGQTLVLSVGQLTTKKGYPHLIAACRYLKDRGYDFTCEIVGEGPVRQELETLITKLELEDSVSLCGAMRHEAVIEKYRKATLFVLPCVLAEDGGRDGIPNVLLEAMAMQLPVVSTRHSGIPELVQHRTNGLLVPPADEVALADAMAELLDTPALRRQLAQRGQQTVTEHFDVEGNVRRLYDLFVAQYESRRSPLASEERTQTDGSVAAER